ncbi:class I SAM-dependent methyltransferase [Blastococcus jejuensis]|uniref:Class I SAM-dependent methyltransferase n=1 Tax=Blastococcus jejuensis TaxID=351224 RepID=A0ABP6P6R1_9ACTN
MARTGTGSDTWSSGERYEPYVGRWSRRVAERFVAWLDLPPGLRWLDVGCGTGALTEAVLLDAAPASVLGVDPSPGFLGHAAATVPDPRATFALGDARALPVADHSVDAVVSGLVLNFVPDPAAALAEFRRAARPGGTVAFYVWDYAGGMQMMRWFWDVAVELDPAAAAQHEGSRFALCRPDPLRDLAATAGLAGVDVTEIVVPTVFPDFDDYWTPFLSAQAPAPSYVASLDDGRRTALREALRDRLPTADDGTISLTARAWAVRGH